MSDEPTTCPFASFTSEPSALCVKSTWSTSVVADAVDERDRGEQQDRDDCGMSWRRITSLPVP